MIVNFFEPYKGRITLNHNDLKMVDKKVLRQYINYLLNKLISLVALSWTI